MHSGQAGTEILSGTPAQLAPCVIAEVARYRHRVFVERLGWPLCSRTGLEFDQFDRPDTLYLAARGSDGALKGTARLLPTHRPYLLGEVFPQLMGRLPLPCSPEVWELSRFAAVDLAAPPEGADPLLSSPVAIGLLEAALALATSAGAVRLITVSPLGIERLLRRAGFRAYRAAPPKIVDGRLLFACWIEPGEAIGARQRTWASGRPAPPRA